MSYKLLKLMLVLVIFASIFSVTNSARVKNNLQSTNNNKLATYNIYTLKKDKKQTFNNKIPQQISK